MRQPKRCVYSFVALWQLLRYLCDDLLREGSQIDGGTTTENAFLGYIAITLCCKTEVAYSGYDTGSQTLTKVAELHQEHVETDR